MLIRFVALCIMLCFSNRACSGYGDPYSGLAAIPVAGGGAISCISFPATAKGDVGYSIAIANCPGEIGIAVGILLSVSNHIKLVFAFGGGWRPMSGVSCLFCFSLHGIE